MRRHCVRARERVSRFIAVGAPDGLPSLFDVGVFLLIVLDQRGRGIGKSSLADLIRCGGDRFTGRPEQEAERQISYQADRDTTSSQWPAGGLGPRLVVCWKMHFGQV